MAVKKKRRRAQGAGAVRQLTSGRWQARYPSPTEVVEVRDAHGNTSLRAKLLPAPRTFDTKLDAEAWLDGESWLEPEEQIVERVDPTLKVYADAWLAGRDLKPRTRAHYRRLLDQQILPDLGGRRLSTISPAMVRTWYGSIDGNKPTLRAHAYALLRTVLASAVDEDIVSTNPCRIRGAGSSKRAHEVRPASLVELEQIVAAMPAPYRLLVLLAAWCALRVGEVTELRRGDVDVEEGVLRIRRGVVWVDHQYVVGDPKTSAGKRTVALPPHLLPTIVEHLELYVGPGRDALLFPGRSGGWLPASTLRDMFRTARSAAGRPDLRFHDLRHTGAVLAAATGATLAELMARLGHTTPAAAMRYQHAAADRDKAIAAALSDLATGTNVVPLKPRRRTASGK